MIWFFLIAAAIIAGLFLVTPFLRQGDTPPARGKISLGLIGFILAAIGIYALIGRPELTAPNALTAYTPPPAPSSAPSSAPSGPSAADVQAAQQMSPEDRAAMIVSMVDGLAEKLKDNPDNPAGWARLLRARTVLGQEEQRAKDIETVKTIFADRPDVMAKILGEP